VFNSRWIEEAIKVNSVHPRYSDAPFRRLHHYALLFHDEMLEALALDVESRLVNGTMREIMVSLTGTLAGQPHRAGDSRCLMRPYDRPPNRQMTASAASRSGRYGAGRPGCWARSWHAWRTGTPARLAAARM